MKELKHTRFLTLAILWFCGIAAVEGAGWTLLTIFIPPVGMYFGVELFLKYFGVL